jgi:hypothetical protein
MRINRRACSANICTALFISPNHIRWISTNRRQTGLSSWHLSAYSMHRSRVSRFAPARRPVPAPHAALSTQPGHVLGGCWSWLEPGAL